ncbi:helix-turn-helix domain-containing protein [Paenibacillus polymyxa]|uniref:Helix-turn-helix domain n=1 Tax=Paenibacillus polymyxa TaxID=1406 RepID=A0A378XVC2_PAEPO|nr:helix-turn-helix transcriptional regulator [Paenibacillus polymyxa]MBE7897214.1 helix-turn-helix transcriptional regulator [Paenibacillus polymyxa]MBG9763067.1 hypothetical protein [Paenibacillus polymyxa]MCC3257536.1 helix-turn-helix domain-containing protein [Paenibacillus polymyxa]QPK51376.1 helix-turn-helix transcriptional regulator [Paenibacillus polymyxa]UOD88110.1 XRE family transcriptional regulator [Paenibacillus polymyxa ATCC 842]
MSTVNNNLNTIGERLFVLRKSKNLSMQELASQLLIPVSRVDNKDIVRYKAVAQSTINNIEKDINKPTSDIIIAICNFFDVSADWFLTGKEYEPRKEEQVKFSASIKLDDNYDEHNDMQRFIYETAINYVQSDEFTEKITKKIKDKIKKEDS